MKSYPLKNQPSPASTFRSWPLTRLVTAYAVGSSVVNNCMRNCSNAAILLANVFLRPDRSGSLSGTWGNREIGFNRMYLQGIKQHSLS